MRRVSRDENAAFAVALRAQQMLRPFIDGKHLELNRHGQRLLEDFGHFRVAGGGCVQGPVACAVLQDDEWEQWSLGDVVVASLAHGDALVKIVATEKRLAQLADISFALQWNAKLLANGAGAAVASDQIRGTHRFLRGVIRLHDRGH